MRPLHESATDHRNRVERLRIVQAAQIAGRLTEERPRDCTADHLSTASLWQSINHEDVLWCEGFPKLLVNVRDEAGFRRRRGGGPVFEDDETYQGSAFQIIRNPNCCRLTNFRMSGERTFHLAWSNAFARYFKRVVRTAEEKPLTVLIDHRPIGMI